MLSKLLIIFLLLTSTCYATEVCVTIPTQDWTQDQINMREACVHSLSCDTGACNSQIRINGDDICFTDPTFDVQATITAQTILNKYNIFLRRWQQAEAEYLRKKQIADDELVLNPLTTEWLETIDVSIDNISNLAEAKIFLKKLIRYLIAKEFLEGRR